MQLLAIGDNNPEEAMRFFGVMRTVDDGTEDVDAEETPAAAAV